MAIWGVNYGVIGLGGMSLYFILRTTTEIPRFIFFFLCHARAFFEHLVRPSCEVDVSSIGSFL